MASQQLFTAEPALASEVSTTPNPQAAEIPQGTPQLDYEPLSNPTSFRLLQILSNGGQDILRCRMFDADLGAPETPSYIALSYTWHEESLPKTSRPILINDKYLNISINLWNFLQNYRETAGERIIWIDQICINQDDLDERVQQIRQMCSIYQHASRDLFWVGEPDEDTVAVMDMLVALYRLEAAVHQYPPSSALLNPIYLTAVGLPMYPSQIWGSLMKFISRSAFQRAWIIQEIAVSRKASLLCGLELLPFDILGKACTFLAESSWIKVLHDEYQVSGAVGFLTGMMNCRTRHQEGQHQSLDLLLASTRRFKATNPVDKVYALINLAESTLSAPLDPLLQPDYRKSMVDVFRDVTLYLISQGSLDILSGIEDAKFRHHHQLPSWVPDFSVHQVISILCMPPIPGHLTLYRAASQRPVSFKYSAADPNALVLSTYKFDTITKVALVADQGMELALENWAGMLDFTKSYPSVYGEAGRLIDAFWRTLVGNIELGAEEYPVIQERICSFAAFAMQAREKLMQHFSSQDAPARQGRGEQSLTPGIDSIITVMQNGPPVEKPLDSDAGRFQSTMHHVSWSRRLFVTETGYIGLAPASTQVGDMVVLFSGGRVPFIIRKIGSDTLETYRIVGESYVHGVMDGELLSVDRLWTDLRFK